MSRPADGAASGRERILDAAYVLFSRSGVTRVGVDTVIAEAGVAKATLYRNFSSKEELALAFLQRREELWTHGWLEEEIRRRADNPRERLLAIFDVFDEWFHREDFEGCAFVTVLLELEDRDSGIRRAAVHHLANIRDLLAGLAADAGIDDPVGFAWQWHILMKGSIVAAHEGDVEAARRAQGMGRLVLDRSGG